MVERKAQYLYNQRHIDESAVTRENRLVCSYAYAVSEQNADNGTIVTAPTCGACAVLPSVLKYMQDKHGFSDKQIAFFRGMGAVLNAGIKFIADEGVLCEPDPFFSGKEGKEIDERNFVFCGCISHSVHIFL